MQELLKKMNYKGQDRIALINAGEDFIRSISNAIPEVQIDLEIDPRYPYQFMIIFVQFVCEIEDLAPRVLHNIVTDGILWFVYPKKTSKKLSSDVYRDHGWEVLLDRGFDKVRQVSVDDDWSALRFRNVRFIRSSSNR